MLLKHRMKEILEGRRPGKKILWLLSLLYQAGIRLRHRAYKLRLLSPKKVPAVVVSVGNIVAGGAGKTPLVHFLACELAKENKVAILSRGYHSEAEDQNILVEPSMTAAQVGDEPLWLARKLPTVQVWVGSDRVVSAQKAIENGAEILLMDDGFQHLRLHRDFDVVVVSGDAPYSNGYFLPRGFLRDLPSRLNSASLIATMGTKPLDLAAPQVVFERTTTADLMGKKVALFCAIGNPERFLKQVQAAGAHITVSFMKPDHAPFTIQELEELAQKSKADCLVCTEKDFVKLPENSLPIIAVSLELSIRDGEEVWKQFINQIKSQVQHVRISSRTS
ncbi:MAG: tetraacyldisaccharide 4'-kinase [Rhabdochlamydiaceae bacterium]|nr:tetraacyldisaccharide 4'-kinase [Rhabdochlamydiaceae bacterium]